MNADLLRRAVRRFADVVAEMDYAQRRLAMLRGELRRVPRPDLGPTAARAAGQSARVPPVGPERPAVPLRVEHREVA